MYSRSKAQDLTCERAASSHLLSTFLLMYCCSTCGLISIRLFCPIDSYVRLPFPTSSWCFCPILQKVHLYGPLPYKWYIGENERQEVMHDFEWRCITVVVEVEDDILLGLDIARPWEMSECCWSCGVNHTWAWEVLSNLFESSQIPAFFWKHRCLCFYQMKNIHVIQIHIDNWASYGFLPGEDIPQSPLARFAGAGPPYVHGHSYRPLSVKVAKGFHFPPVLSLTSKI